MKVGNIVPGICEARLYASIKDIGKSDAARLPATLISFSFLSLLRDTVGSLFSYITKNGRLSPRMSLSLDVSLSYTSEM